MQTYRKTKSIHIEQGLAILFTCFLATFRTLSCLPTTFISSVTVPLSAYAASVLSDLSEPGACGLHAAAGLVGAAIWTPPT